MSSSLTSNTLTECAISTSPSEDRILVWDIRTLTVLGSYKQNIKIASKNGVCMVGTHHLASIQADKATMKVWRWDKDLPVLKFGLPERMTAIVSSPDGSMIVGGSITGKIYVWLTVCGSLIRVIDSHFKSISVVKFSKDGQYLVTGGDDAMCNIYNVASIVTGVNCSVQNNNNNNFNNNSSNNNNNIVPLYSLTGHALPITDVYIGYGNANSSRVYTVSLDRYVLYIMSNKTNNNTNKHK